MLCAARHRRGTHGLVTARETLGGEVHRVRLGRLGEERGEARVELRGEEHELDARLERAGVGRTTSFAMCGMLGEVQQRCAERRTPSCRRVCCEKWAQRRCQVVWRGECEGCGVSVGREAAQESKRSRPMAAGGGAARRRVTCLSPTSCRVAACGNLRTSRSHPPARRRTNDLERFQQHVSMPLVLSCQLRRPWSRPTLAAGA
jgi:hypothetical protein